MAFIEDSSPQKIATKILKVGLFVVLASTNARRKIAKRRKKMNCSLHSFYDI